MKLAWIKYKQFNSIIIDWHQLLIKLIKARCARAVIGCPNSGINHASLSPVSFSRLSGCCDAHSQSLTQRDPTESAGNSNSSPYWIFSLNAYCIWFQLQRRTKWQINFLIGSNLLNTSMILAMFLDSSMILAFVTIAVHARQRYYINKK